MKIRILALLLVLGAVISNESYASRARTLVLGNGNAGTVLDEGSFFYEDSYNMFYNPVYVNDYKDWAIFEKSNYPGSTSMGGFTTGLGPVAFGAFFNRTSGTHNLLVNRANEKPIDLLFGMDHGSFKWGFGASYGSYRDASAAVDNYAKNWTLRFGASFANLEPYFDWTAVGSTKVLSTGVTSKAKHAGAGLRYHYGDWTPYAGWRYDRIENSTKNTNFGGGLGRSMKFGDSGVGMNYAVSFWRNNDTKRSILPIDMSVEGDATDWMTLRAGVSYRLIDKTSGNDQTDSASGRIGGTFHVKKLDVNFAVGSGTVTAEAAGTANGQAFGFSDNFFTAASVEYKW